MELRSHNITKGVERVPNRSLLRACGLTEEEMARPIIGVVSAYSEIIPGHINLDKIAAAVKTGVSMAGGTPILVPAIGVCDGIAMGHIGMKYSLPSRKLIADSVETLAQAHQFDALVLIPNCDKIVPGMVMAAARLNIPSIVVSGGPMLSINQWNTSNFYAGAELRYDYKNIFSFSAAGVYRSWDTKDDSQLTGNYALAYKPAFEANLHIDVRPISSVLLSLGYQHVSREKVEESKVDAVNNLYLGGTYEFLKGISVYARINNLLNRDYQYYWGYPTEGINFIGGVSFKF